jgi:hypothetical protein
MKGSGGTQGGIGQFVIGAIVSGLAAWLFFDSVRMTTNHFGWIRNSLSSGQPWTDSMAIVFMPFGLGVFALFYNAQQKWAWWLTWIGLAMVVIEMLSSVRFSMSIKTSHFLVMLVAFLCGAAMMFNSYRNKPQV